MALSPTPAPADDYPTATRAEYVFACMASNGQTPEVLRKCACSIDAIAERVPYASYEKVETILAMQQIPGGRAAYFKEAAWAKELLEELRRAQAEANLKCF
ncbi:hypothetical protein TSO221_29960 [Azospirillum sp. TSO22-1]|nr:hypothetical protein TSO221_29960 [Azospirillum sp. TSO22-1]